MKSSAMSGQPFAVFDIDGTIIRWQLFHAIIDALAEDKQLSPEMYAKIREARHKWQTRTHEESFKEYEHSVVEVFIAVLKGMEVAAYTKAAQRVFEEHKDQVYRYTRDMIADLKKQNYVLFAVSGSPSEVVEPFAKYYGFDDFVATVHEHDGHRYTGVVQLVIGRKGEVVKELAAKHGLSFAGSIGVGDSEGDIAMLECTETAIAFNPTKKLFAHAQGQHWRIAIERKNMIYELREQNGRYILQ